MSSSPHFTRTQFVTRRRVESSLRTQNFIGFNGTSCLRPCSRSHEVSPLMESSPDPFSLSLLLARPPPPPVLGRLLLALYSDHPSFVVRLLAVGMRLRQRGGGDQGGGHVRGASAVDTLAPLAAAVDVSSGSASPLLPASLDVLLFLFSRYRMVVLLATLTHQVPR